MRQRIKTLRECGWLALDGFEGWTQAIRVARQMRGKFFGVKVHPLAYSQVSPRWIISDLQEIGYQTWLDEKLGDIPSVVSAIVTSLARGGADLVSVHGSDSIAPLSAAVAAFRAVPIEECVRPIPGLGVVAITPLTSMRPEDVERVYNKSLEERALEVAKYADIAGAYGVVCSPLEVRALRSTYPGLKYFTPGIRLLGSPKDDHERIGTPAYALAQGADYLVIGREILRDAGGEGWNPDMLGAVERIEENIAIGV